MHPIVSALLADVLVVGALAAMPDGVLARSVRLTAEQYLPFTSAQDLKNAALRRGLVVTHAQSSDLTSEWVGLLRTAART